MLRKLAGIAVLLALAVPGTAMGQVASDIFTMARVPVEATAPSAEEARLIAQDQGRAQSFQLLMRRLTRSSDWPYLPRPRLSELLDMQVGFEVENERFSTQAGDENNYLANITYSFRPDRVRALLQSQNIPFSESQASSALVLPVFEINGQQMLWQEDNPWAASWYGRDLTHELVPLLMPLGDISDSSAVTLQDVVTGNWDALEYLATRYGVSRIFVAHAALLPDGQGGRLYARMTEITARGAGQVYDTQATGVPQIETEGHLGEMGDRAILLLSSQLQERWKAQTLVSYDQLHQLEATARFNDLDEWLTIREALEDSATITDYDAFAMSTMGAQVLVTFAGTARQLGITLAQRGVALSGTRGYWDLRAAGSSHAELPGAMNGAQASLVSGRGSGGPAGSMPPVRAVENVEPEQQNAPTLSDEDLQSIFGDPFTEEELEDRRERGLGEQPGTMVPVGN